MTWQIEKSRALKDFGDEEYHAMVRGVARRVCCLACTARTTLAQICVEPGVVSRWESLPAGSTFRLAQTIAVV